MNRAGGRDQTRPWPRELSSDHEAAGGILEPFFDERQYSPHLKACALGKAEYRTTQKNFDVSDGANELAVCVANKKSTSARQRAGASSSIEMSQSSARLDWTTVEVDFFARESDLYQVGPVDTFDDLDD